MKPEPDAVRLGFAAAKANRLEYVDAVRVILILLVVALHSAEAYLSPRPVEFPLPDPPIPRAWVFLWVNAAFFMGLFFFLAGYFTPGAFDRKGGGASAIPSFFIRLRKSEPRLCFGRCIR